MKMHASKRRWMLVLSLLGTLAFAGSAMAATIKLSDEGIQIEGSGAQAQGSVLTITADGVYELSGSLTDGQIIVNAPDAAKVELILAGWISPARKTRPSTA